MKYINGIPEQTQNPLTNDVLTDWFNQLPEPVDKHTIAQITNKAEKMQKSYKLFIKRNKILTIISMLESELKEINDEIAAI